MSKKKIKVLSVIIAFSLCFPLHFFYDNFPSFLTSIFAPVNESLWEHMKMLFGSIILTGVIQKIIIHSKKEKINNVCISNFIGALTSIPIFLIIYLPIYNFVGENLAISIIIMFITIVIAEIISYKIMNKRDFKLEHLTVFFVIIVYIIFALLTYFPPRNGIFIDPTTSTYGIKR